MGNSVLDRKLFNPVTNTWVPSHMRRRLAYPDCYVQWSMRSRGREQAGYVWASLNGAPVFVNNEIQLSPSQTPTPQNR